MLELLSLTLSLLLVVLAAVLAPLLLRLGLSLEAALDDDLGSDSERSLGMGGRLSVLRHIRDLHKLSASALGSVDVPLRLYSNAARVRKWKVGYH